MFVWTQYWVFVFVFVWSGYLGVCKYLCLCELSICVFVFVWTQYWVFVFVWVQCWMFVLVFVWSEYLGVCEYLCLCGLSIWVSTIERAVSPPAHSVLLREIYPENPLFSAALSRIVRCSAVQNSVIGGNLPNPLFTSQPFSEAKTPLN